MSITSSSLIILSISVPYRLEYCILDIISTAPLYYIPCYLYGEDVMTFSQLDEIQWYQ